MQIALILPRYRLGTWHESLAESLSGTHDVKVFIDDGMPPYPLPIRTWLGIERRLYRQQRGASSNFSAEALLPSNKVDGSKFDAVIDLSERPQPRSNVIAIRYGGSTDSMALVDRLLGQQTPRLTVSKQGMDGVLGESFPAIDDKFRLSRGLQLSFGRCIALIERALDSERVRSASKPAAPTTTSHGLAAFIGRFVTQKMTNMLVGRLTSVPQWSVALRNTSGPFVPVDSEKQRFYADPFLYAWSGKTFLFVEDYSDTTKKAVISAAEVAGHRLASAPVPVLERPYHLSYPLVFAEAEDIFMLPETVGNRSLELYRTVAFPWEWQLESVLIEGMALADATPVFHQNRWWLFASMAQHGTTDQDELFIFYSDKLAGPWRPHSENPVKSDCRSARPAGRIVRRGNRLFRPAQDCERAYGSGIVWHEITELSPSRFQETEIARVRPPYDLGLDGLHHFDQVGELQAIDVRAIRSFGASRPRERKAMSCLGSGLDRTFQAAVSCNPL